MKTILLITILLLSKFIFAQENTAHSRQLDSLKRVVKVREDSLNNLANKATSKVDTLRKILSLPGDKINKAESYAQTKIQSGIDKIKSGTSDRVQSPKNKADSLLAPLESGKQKIENALSKPKQELDSIQTAISSSLQKGESKVESGFSKLTGENIDYPGFEKQPDVSIPKTGFEIPDANMSLDTSLKFDESLGNRFSTDIKIPETKSEISSSFGIEKPGELDQLDKLGDEINKIDAKLGEAGNYEEDLQKIKEGNVVDVEKLPDLAEQKIAETAEVNAFKNQADKAMNQQAAYAKLIQSYKDKKLVQAEIKRKAANIASDYLTKEIPAVEQAREQYSNGKRLFGNAKKTKDMIKNKPHEFQEKKFYERLVPALTTQVYRKDLLLVDWGIQVGYRFTRRWIAGIGGIYRTSFGEENKYFISTADVYGGRGFGQFSLVKGLFLHAEFETLKVSSYAFTFQMEKSQTHIYSSHFGIGKRFNVNRKIKGTVQGLYRVEYKGTLPAMNKINMRLGFEYVLKKKNKKVFQN